MTKIKKLQTDAWKYPDGKIPLSETNDHVSDFKGLFNDNQDSKNIKFEKSDDHIEIIENTIRQTQLKYQTKKFVLEEKKL
jgi:hypothetical protein